MAVGPPAIQLLTKKGFTVQIEKDAGALANFTNKNLEEAGAKIVDRNAAFQSGKKVVYII